MENKQGFVHFRRGSLLFVAVCTDILADNIRIEADQYFSLNGQKNAEMLGALLEGGEKALWIVVLLPVILQI